MSKPEIKIPPHGYVKYVDHLGSDQRIVEAARVSYQSSSKGDEQDKKLLNYLFSHKHTSPFEQCSITFCIKMPIFVMRQFVRHRTFRLNEWSGRYSELKDEFYLPFRWRAQDTKNKQGSVDSSNIDGFFCSTITEEIFERCFNAYQSMLKAGVAKEQARIVLPVALYTQIFVNCDLHNLMHFLRLRTDPHAQFEIREVADAMKMIAKQLFPWTFEAFERYKFTVTDSEVRI